MKKKLNTSIVLIAIALIVPQFVQAQVSPVFRQEGIASWYGREFDGRPTASGEIFDSSQLTAAHPTLPFGTMLLVTNRHNNRQVIVRVNDRGPFVAARIVDVSRAAAEQLDMIVTGTAPVIIEAVGQAAGSPAAIETARQMAPVSEPVFTPPAPVHHVEAPVHQPFHHPVQPVQQPVAQPQFIPQQPVPQPAAPPQFIPQQPVPQPVAQPQFVPQQPAPPAAPPQFIPQQPVQQPVAPPVRLVPNITIEHNRTYRLQVGSFTVARNAVSAFDRLRSVGLNPAYERFISNNIEHYRVVLPGVRGVDMPAVTELLRQAGFREAIVRIEN